MSSLLRGRIRLVAAVLAVVGMSLVAFHLVAVAAPVVVVQDGETEAAKAIRAAQAWLLDTHQNADGGFSSFSTGSDLAPSDIGGTLDALWALSLSGADSSALIAYLENNDEQLAQYVAQDGSTAGKALLVIGTTDRDVTDFAGLDLVVAVTNHLSPTGQYGVNTAYNQSLPMLGLAIAGQSVPEESIEWLTAQQATAGDSAGSWDDGFGTAGNVDSTAMALAALTTGGRSVDDLAIQAGLEFMKRAQLDSGGWEYGAGFGENANSTAMAVLALTMLGQELTSEDGQWAKNGVDPVSALLSWQGESGAFQADFGDGRFDDFFSTVQALPALGFHELRMGRGPVQAPVVNAPPEMTPTSTPVAAASPEPATVTPAPEPVIVQADEDQPMTDPGASEASGENASQEVSSESDAANDGRLVWPWILLGGGLIALALLGWRLLVRRREA